MSSPGTLPKSRKIRKSVSEGITPDWNTWGDKVSNGFMKASFDWLTSWPSMEAKGWGAAAIYASNNHLKKVTWRAENYTLFTCDQDQTEKAALYLHCLLPQGWSQPSHPWPTWCSLAFCPHCGTHLCFVMNPWLAGRIASSAPLNKNMRSFVRVAFLLATTTLTTSSIKAQLAPSSLAPGPWKIVRTWSWIVGHGQPVAHCQNDSWEVRQALAQVGRGLEICGQQHFSHLCKPGKQLVALSACEQYMFTCVKLPLPSLTSRWKEPSTVCTSTSREVRLPILLNVFNFSTKNLTFRNTYQTQV